MKDRILLLCPSRERAEMGKKLSDCIDSLKINDIVDLVFVLDNDDPQLEEYKKLNLKCFTVDNKRPGLVYPLNYAYDHFKKEYSIYGFIGDDVSIHTRGWETIIFNIIKNKNYDVVAYGNDLLRGDCLLTSFFIGHEFLNKIGYMAYPKLNHVYVDTFWRLVASKVNKLIYLPNVVIKHDHYTITAETKFDSTYHRTSKFAHSDEIVYFEMQNKNLNNIIGLLK